jgi:hypothetical protein
MYFAEGFRAKSDGGRKSNAWHRGVLDLPGAANLVKNHQAKHARINRDRSRSFINQHVVAFFDVVNTNLRISSDFRCFNHSPITGAAIHAHSQKGGTR